jgi:hypothetical protein
MSPLLSALVCVLALLHTCSTAVEAACEYYCVNCVAQTSFPVSSTASTIFTSPCPAGTIFSQSTTTPINLRTAAGSTMQFVVSYQKVGASTSTSVASTNCLQPTDIPSGIALQAVTITAQCTSTSSTSGCEWIGAGQGSCIVPTYSWYAYSWSTCSGACPTGTQTRLVECRYSGTTTTASSSSCNAATKPVTSQSCSLSGCSSSTAIGIMANDPSQGFFVVGAANDNECDPDSDTAKRDLPGLSGTCLQGSSNAHYSSYQVNCYGGNQWQIVWFLDTACAQSDLSVTGKQNECMVVEDKVSILVSCGATSTQATEKFNSAAEDRRQEIQDDKNRKRNTIISQCKRERERE